MNVTIGENHRFYATTLADQWDTSPDVVASLAVMFLYAHCYPLSSVESDILNSVFKESLDSCMEPWESLDATALREKMKVLSHLEEFKDMQPAKAV